MDKMLQYCIFTDVLAEIVEQCETAQQNKTCDRCPLHDDYSKCIRWEENMAELSAYDISTLLGFDAEVHPTDMSFADYKDELEEDE